MNYSATLAREDRKGGRESSERRKRFGRRNSDLHLGKINNQVGGGDTACPAEAADDEARNCIPESGPRDGAPKHSDPGSVSPCLMPDAACPAHPTDGPAISSIGGYAFPGRAT
ncbi:hypothetical protein HPB47_022302 [Ixodes persulcatus]|uniref:Uncharacterized protein n=1 Tax=Ixodes persulcatus TaxID=34615 RepID=A0AC60QA20_IXOPE|nr:hypothetical protein HPB47_022302 [Ixodes persulcatus]